MNQKETFGDILVFLPGKYDCENIKSDLFNLKCISDCH